MADDKIRIDIVQIKRGLKENLIRVLRGSLRPKDGEPIFELDTGKLKFGDGEHDYVDLEYFKTGDVEVADALNGQTLIYNAELDRWEAKNIADNQSIVFGQNGLKIAGYTGEAAQYGAAPVSTNGGIAWQQLPSDAQLAARLEEAAALVRQAGDYKAEAIAACQDAERAQAQTEQVRDLTIAMLNKKFWYGTQAEYIENVLNQNKLTEGTIYFIYDYDYDTFPDDTFVNINDD